LVAKALTLAASVSSILFGRRRWGAILASTFSFLASIIVIAAAGAAITTFVKLNKDLRAAYSSIGLKVDLGRNLFILSWSVALFSLGLTLILISLIKQSGQAQYTRVEKQVGGVLFDQKRERSMDGDRERLVHGNARESIDDAQGGLGYICDRNIRSG